MNDGILIIPHGLGLCFFYGDIVDFSIYRNINAFFFKFFFAYIYHLSVSNNNQYIKNNQAPIWILRQKKKKETNDKKCLFLIGIGITFQENMLNCRIFNTCACVFGTRYITVSVLPSTAVKSSHCLKKKDGIVLYTNQNNY